MIFNKVLFIALLLILTSGSSYAQSSQAKDSFIKFSFNVDSALLVIDLDFENARMIANNAVVPIKSGPHLIQLSTPLDFYPAKDLFVAGGKTVTFYSQFDNSPQVPLEKIHENPTIRPLVKKDALIVTDANTNIYKDGKFVGKGAALLNISKNNSIIQFQNPHFGSEEVTLSSDDNFQVFENYKQPKRNTARLLSMVPGLSQIYKRQYLKCASFIAGIWYTRREFMSYKNEYDSQLALFNSKVTLYLNTRDTEIASRLGDEIEAMQPTIKQAESDKNLFKILSVSLFVANVLDGFFVEPKGGFQKKMLEVSVDVNQATITWNF